MSRSDFSFCDCFVAEPVLSPGKVFGITSHISVIASVSVAISMDCFGISSLAMTTSSGTFSPIKSGRMSWALAQDSVRNDKMVKYQRVREAKGGFYYGHLGYWSHRILRLPCRA